MITALIFETDLPFLRSEAPAASVSPETRLGGLSLLRRAVLMAWRAGARSVIVVASDAEAAERRLEREGALPVAVEVCAAESALPSLESDAVLVQSAVILPQRGVLERLLEAYRQEGRPVVIPLAAGVCGPAVLRGEDLRNAAGQDGAIQTVRRALGTPGIRRLPEETSRVRHLASRDELAGAEADLYQGLTSPADGYIDRVVNRRISRWVTRRLIDLPITPNHVTCFNLALGLGAAWLLSGGVYWQSALGAALLQLSVALDCTDGEIARIKYQFSKFGSWLDVAADNIVTAAVFLAVARVAAASFGPTVGITLGALAVTGVLMCLVVFVGLARFRERRSPGTASSLAALNRLSGQDHAGPAGRGTLADAALNQATSRDFTLIITACALAGHLEWVAWMAGVGSHLFWIGFAAVQLPLQRAADAETR